MARLTEVAQVHDGVNPCLHEDEVADNLVKVDIVVEGEYRGEAQLPEGRDEVAQDQDCYQHRVEEKDSPCKGTSFMTRGDFQRRISDPERELKVTVP